MMPSQDQSLGVARHIEDVQRETSEAQRRKSELLERKLRAKDREIAELQRAVLAQQAQSTSVAVPVLVTGGAGGGLVQLAQPGLMVCAVATPVLGVMQPLAVISDECELDLESAAQSYV